jgi:hypothetical protein
LDIEDPAKRSYCFFIDGLDEFDGDHEVLNDLLKEVASSPHVKICVSSRPWNVFEDAFGQKSFLMLQDLTYSDIQIYVNSMFETNAGFTHLERRELLYANELKDKVAKKAAGVFLWVYLVVKSLLAGLVNGDRVLDLERRLELLPPDLENLYHKMLNSLEPFYFSHASQLFQLVRESIDPPTLLTLSFADEEPDIVFKQKLHSLTIDERVLRADTMRRRLNSNCKGLLEIASNNCSPHDLDQPSHSRWQIIRPGTIPNSEFLQDNRVVLAVEESLAEATVQYLHRTVKDFLESPAVWDRVLEVGPKGYNPRLALCSAFVLQLKNLDPRMLGRHIFWYHVKLCINYAKVDEDPDGKFANLLDELDRSATKLTACAGLDDHSFVSYYSKFTPEEGGLYPHWACTFSRYDPDRGLSFLSLAVKLNLYFYVKARANKNCLVMQDSGLWSILRDSITCDSSFNSFFGIEVFPNLPMVTLLLDHGADPNWSNSFSTVWEFLLEEATSVRAKRSERGHMLLNGDIYIPEENWKLVETRQLRVRVLCKSPPGNAWIEAIYEFLTRGADPTIDLEAGVGLSFLGALKSDTQVYSNKSIMKSWFGIGNQVKVRKT